MSSQVALELAVCVRYVFPVPLPPLEAKTLDP